MKEYKKRIADKLLKYRLEEVGAVLVERGVEKRPPQSSLQKACYIWRIQAQETAAWKWLI